MERDDNCTKMYENNPSVLPGENSATKLNSEDLDTKLI